MFKVGDKFIIEISSIMVSQDERFKKPLYLIKDCGVLCFNDEALNRLESCGDEKEAYEKGYAKAMEDVRKTVHTLLAMDYRDKDLYFGGSHITVEILSKFDVREIVERLEAYEKEQSEIRVGDEVEVIDFGCEAVVTCTNKHLKSVFVLYTDGSTDEFTDRNRTKLRKTGRHFDEVEKLIEVLKGGEGSDEISF